MSVLSDENHNKIQTADSTDGTIGIKMNGSIDIPEMNVDSNTETVEWPELPAALENEENHNEESSIEQDVSCKHIDRRSYVLEDLRTRYENEDIPLIDGDDPTVEDIECNHVDHAPHTVEITSTEECTRSVTSCSSIDESSHELRELLEKYESKEMQSDSSDNEETKAKIQELLKEYEQDGCDDELDNKLFVMNGDVPRDRESISQETEDDKIEIEGKTSEIDYSILINEEDEPTEPNKELILNNSDDLDIAYEQSESINENEVDEGNNIEEEGDRYVKSKTKKVSFALDDEDLAKIGSELVTELNEACILDNDEDEVIEPIVEPLQKNEYKVNGELQQVDQFQIEDGVFIDAEDAEESANKEGVSVDLENTEKAANLKAIFAEEQPVYFEEEIVVCEEEIKVCVEVDGIPCDNSITLVSSNEGSVECAEITEVCKEVCDDIVDEVCDNVFDDVCDQDEIRVETFNEFVDETSAEVCDETCDEICDKTCDEICDENCDEICDDVCEECDELCDENCDEVCDENCDDTCDVTCDDSCEEVELDELQKLRLENSVLSIRLDGANEELAIARKERNDMRTVVECCERHYDNMRLGIALYVNNLTSQTKRLKAALPKKQYLGLVGGGKKYLRDELIDDILMKLEELGRLGDESALNEDMVSTKNEKSREDIDACVSENEDGEKESEKNSELAESIDFGNTRIESRNNTL